MAAEEVVPAPGRRRGRPTAKPAGGQNQSLRRAMRVLEQLAAAERGRSLTDLSQLLDLPAATVHRLLNTFEQLGYVQQDDERGHWFIGVKAFAVGSAFLNRRDLIGAARPVMRRLVEDSGETVNLSVLDDGEVVFVSQIESREMMRMVVPLGSRAPIHASGAGKAMLATLPEQDVAAIVRRRGLPRYTDHTLTAAAALGDALADVRRHGCAIDDEEHAIGLRCVAATVHDEHGAALAALSLSGPTARIVDARLSALRRLVVGAAAEVTGALGGRVPAACAGAEAVSAAAARGAADGGGR